MLAKLHALTQMASTTFIIPLIHYSAKPVFLDFSKRIMFYSEDDLI